MASKSHICRKDKWKQYDMTDNSKEMKQIFLGEELFNKWCWMDQILIFNHKALEENMENDFIILECESLSKSRKKLIKPSLCKLKYSTWKKKD